MKKLTLFSPGVSLTSPRFGKCSWCQDRQDPGSSGLCRLCYKTVKNFLRSERWASIRRVRFGLFSTSICCDPYGRHFTTLSPEELQIQLAEADLFSPPGISSSDAQIQVSSSVPEPNSTSTADELVLVELNVAVLQPDGRYRLRLPVDGEIIDHIKPWNQFPSLFWDTTNHQTLCRGCHSVKSHDDGSFGQPARI